MSRPLARSLAKPWLNALIKSKLLVLALALALAMATLLPFPTATATTEARVAMAIGTDFPAAAGVSPTVLPQMSKIMGIHGVNYYPRQSPWSKFWPGFDARVVGADFDRIRGLGFTSVRIFVPYGQFGGPAVSPVLKQRLHRLLALAQARRLGVIVTLFDFYTDYGRPDAAIRHLGQLVAGLERHPAILAWDLKNELDLDYAAASRGVVLAWVRTLAASLRGRGVRQPVTASFSRPEAAADAAADLDYLTFHYYGPEADFAPRVAALRRRTSRPLVLGEYGYHTWQQGQDPHPPEHQFNYVAAIQAAALRARLGGSLAWTLYDFAPTLREPWVLTSESVQHHLGLIDLAGRPKPGLAALQQGAWLIDAVTGRAPSLETRRLMLVLRTAAPLGLSLERRQNGLLLARQHWQLPAGVSSPSWTVSATEIRELIHLRQRYVLLGKGLLGPGDHPLPASLPLELRRR